MGGALDNQINSAFCEDVLISLGLSIRGNQFEGNLDMDYAFGRHQTDAGPRLEWMRPHVGVRVWTSVRHRGTSEEQLSAVQSVAMRPLNSILLL